MSRLIFLGNLSSLVCFGHLLLGKMMSSLMRTDSSSATLERQTPAEAVNPNTMATLKPPLLPNKAWPQLSFFHNVHTKSQEGKKSRLWLTHYARLRILQRPCLGSFGVWKCERSADLCILLNSLQATFASQYDILESRRKGKGLPIREFLTVVRMMVDH